MAKLYSTNFKEKVNSTSGEAPSYLLEITHPQLSVPIRLTNDSDDIVSNGNTFLACPFRVRFPDDIQGSTPRVPVSVDNIGRELTQWIDASQGGRGAQVRIMQIMRNDPNTIECEYTMTLMNVHQNMMEISGELGYENVLDIPYFGAVQTPVTQPGIF